MSLVSFFLNLDHNALPELMVKFKHLKGRSLSGHCPAPLINESIDFTLEKYLATAQWVTFIKLMFHTDICS